MKKFTCIILVLLLNGVLPAQEKDKKPNSKIHKFELAVLYIDSSAGRRFKKGIEAAISEYDGENIGIDITPVSYDNETDGLDKLVSMIRGKAADIIIGPTDSGIFERAVEQRSELEQYRVPVISSRLTAKIPHRKGGWFFRTDINVERRAWAMCDVLNKSSVRSIVVLFEGTEFGIRAERAFRGQLRGLQKKRYFALSYEPGGKGRNQIRRILQLRPEAAGIFGEHKNIAPLYRSLKILDTGWPRYLPLTFSLTDTRSIKDRPRNNYFVSLTDITKDKRFDDVKALAFDTTILILRQLDALTQSESFNHEDPSWRQLFRNRFEAVLNGVIGFEQGDNKTQSKTGISFKDYENNTIPKVYRWEKRVAAPFDFVESIGFLKKIGQRVTHIWNSAGFYLVFNIFLVIVVCLVFSMWDIIGWYVGEKEWKLEKWKFFFKCLFVSVNVPITLFVYFYLGETGRIRYGNLMPAFILSFVLAAGLRFPLRRFYYHVAPWVFDSTYSKWEINRVAYYNNVKSMTRILKDISHRIPDREKRIRMRVRMEEIVRNPAVTELSMRKSLARLLLQYPGWDEPVTLFDYPEEVIRQAAAHHYSPDGEEQKQIEEQINGKLKTLSEEPTSPELLDKREYSRLERLKKTKKSSLYNMREKITLLFLLKESEFLKNLQEEDFFQKSWDVPDG
jgi:hypothetical protein